MKKLFALLLVLTMIFGTFSTTAFAAGSSRGSFSSHSYSSSSHTSPSFSTSGTYRSGVKRPSSSVTTPSYRQPYSTPSYQQPSSSGWGKFFGGMVAGSLLTHMFHPFGGYYGYGSPYGSGAYGFSFWGLLIDLVVLYIIFRIVRGIFFRR